MNALGLVDTVSSATGKIESNIPDLMSLAKLVPKFRKTAQQVLKAFAKLVKVVTCIWQKLDDFKDFLG